ncbi:MAG: hypothetical protein Q9165_007526 [Trypethelium subeluteriae]
MGGQEPRPIQNATRQTGIIAIAIVAPVLAAIVAALRLITRIWIVRKVGWDDYTIVGAVFGRIIIAQAIISIISDFMLALFPIVILWKVQISTRIKAGLCTLMALGLICSTGALCIVRTVLNWQTINDDATWESIPNWHFRTWELTFPGQAAHSYPALRGAAHVASVEADRAAEVGAGDETFPLQGIRGDVSTMEQGKIKKTTWFGTESDAEVSSD